MELRPCTKLLVCGGFSGDGMFHHMWFGLVDRPSCDDKTLVVALCRQQERFLLDETRHDEPLFLVVVGVPTAIDGMFMINANQYRSEFVRPCMPGILTALGVMLRTKKVLHGSLINFYSI